MATYTTSKGGKGAVDTKTLLLAWRRLLAIRRFEEEGERRLRLGEVIGTYHSSIGEEATYVGACLPLRDDDYITGTHRSHGHPIAKGAKMGPLAAEIMGKATGICKGKAGTKHLADFSVGVLGESAILSSSMPVAVGAALAAQLEGSDRVVISFFGDGAAQEGIFHEALNLASLWKLPVIFLCENNFYAVGLHYRQGVSVDQVSDRAAGYSMPGATVDGQDVLAVYEAAKAAVDRARAGLGPSLIEAMTYRFGEHTVQMVSTGRRPYRSDEEVERWKKRDPLDLFRQWALGNGVASAATLDKIDREVTAEAVEAWEFAARSPFPTDEDIWHDTWAQPIPPEQRRRLL